MRTPVAPVSLLPVLSLALVLPGCSLLSKLVAEDQPATSAAPAAMTDSSSPSLQWDFAKRADEEKTSQAAQETQQPAKAAPPQELPSPSVPARSSGWRGWIPGFSNGKNETDGNPQYVTEADLLKVVAEFQRVAGKDTYRFPIPKDVTGANIYKATLTRLQDYEAKHPGAYPELLAFTCGRAYEGLHEYEKASAQYQIVSQSKNRLSAEAAEAIAVLARFQEIKQRPLAASTPLAYLQALDNQVAAWQDLQKQQAGTPYEALAREEEERLDWAKVAFLELNRYRIEDGNESVVLAYRQ